MSRRQLVFGAGAIVTAGVMTTHAILQNSAYTVREVTDGDTFITKENQMIRLASIDAPEMGRCGSQDAKTALEKLILGKKLYLKIVFREKYNRLVAYVYTSEGSVNQKMLASGLSVWSRYYNENDPDLEQIAKTVKAQKIGIFSETCTQTVNKLKPKCRIKANLKSGNNLYRFPGCGQYNNTEVQLFAGDAWFCTEKEARDAGFSKGSDCFNNTWKTE